MAQSGAGTPQAPPSSGSSTTGTSAAANPAPTASVGAPIFGRVPPDTFSAPATQPVLPPISNRGLPELGDSSQTSLSPAEERKIGAAVVREARAAGEIMDDPEVTDYLNDLGQRLVAAVPDATMNFEFFAVADNQINAFALPGGYIGVNTGLILLTQSESELAAVLGHEITHVTQHHVARMIAAQKDMWLMSLGALALAILAARSGAGGATAAQAGIASAQALSIQSQLNFTREAEYEADRIGFQRMVAAGFDPNAMASFMTRMQTATRFVDGNAPSYLRSHPVTFERIAEAQARASSLPYKQVPDSLDFQMVRALLRSYQGEPKDAVNYFQRSLAEHQYNSEVAARYGLVAAYLRDKDYVRAKEALAALEKMAPAHPMIDAMAGHVLMESGDLPGAIARFKAGVARYPNKMQLVYDYPEALLRAGRDKEAAEFAESELARFPDNGPLQLIAARAYGAQNKELKQHQHQGEFYAWQGNLKGAITQFELAEKATDADFYSASVVEMRLRALRKQADDESKKSHWWGEG
jgi:predicted Zn-dependent protease